jgi:hypothetical protein
LRLHHARGQLDQELAVLRVLVEQQDVPVEVVHAPLSGLGDPVGKDQGDSGHHQVDLHLHGLHGQLGAGEAVGQVDEQVADARVGQRLLAEGNEAGPVEVTAADAVVEVKVPILLQAVGQHVVQVGAVGVQANAVAGGLGLSPGQLIVDAALLLASAAPDVDPALVLAPRGHAGFSSLFAR